MGSSQAKTRQLLSALDILVNAQLSQFAELNLTPPAVIDGPQKNSKKPVEIGLIPIQPSPTKSKLAVTTQADRLKAEG